VTLPWESRTLPFQANFQIEEIRPAFSSAHATRPLSEDACRRVRRCRRRSSGERLWQVQDCRLELGLEGEESPSSSRCTGWDVLDHVGCSGVGVVGHEVEDPEGRVPAELAEISGSLAASWGARCGMPQYMGA